MKILISIKVSFKPRNELACLILIDFEEYIICMFNTLVGLKKVLEIKSFWDFSKKSRRT
jgi:hypothetical protein